ncbi:hypothetical protein KY290_000813 [Solanum tuberosum]|uniref:Uncharacterized protein n=1 Tax=Solanum tuberosum TaxID=4113 RepID=A0ABQ7WMK0_SOLTU|nr:hypothetical protein KY290_000813 [Solanum tuberosum]
MQQVKLTKGIIQATDQKEDGEKIGKEKIIKRPKREKIEVHHYQKPRRPVTLEEFLPSSFCTKSTQDNVEASCFNFDK